MHKLKAITPLGADTLRVDTVGTLTITEVVDKALASVASRQGQKDALRAALQKSHGLTLPEVGLTSTAGALAAFWAGPEQWMVSAPHDSHELLAAELKQAVEKCASVVEQTDGWCRFDVEGPALCDLFERLSSAPVRSMASGAVIRGTVEHLGAFLWRSEETRMAVIAPRSSAASLHHALVAAAHSIA